MIVLPAKVYDGLLDSFMSASNAASSGNIIIPDIVEWAEERFFIVETGRPIQLMPHQKRILRLFTERAPDGAFRWRNCIYSTIKKSGKTTISALYARWAAECWGPYQEVYNLGNKLKQAKDRAFKAAKRSIQLAGTDIQRDWQILETRMTHLPSGSFIEALPIAGAAEAGGNTSLSVWTELWGFQYDEALLMWDELKPVPTRPLSQRFIDTYAGFEGVSELLKEWWDKGLAGDRLDDELPVYGNEAAGLIAYIDTGEEARRMPWQQGEKGKVYYQEQAVTERPENYQRHHLNEWASSTDRLINIALWDRLENDIPPVRDVVLGADASVSGDCTALAVVGYDAVHGIIYEIETHAWTPPKNGKLDYDETLTPEIEACIKRYNVIGVAYDPYQLHQVMTSLGKKYPRIDFYSFPQGGERIQSDTDLLTRIRQGTLTHTGNDTLREHLQNADAKASGDKAIRIVKRASDKHIDAVIALSMAAWRIAHMEPKRAHLRIGQSTGLYHRR